VASSVTLRGSVASDATRGKALSFSKANEHSVQVAGWMDSDIADDKVSAKLNAAVTSAPPASQFATSSGPAGYEGSRQMTLTGRF